MVALGLPVFQQWQVVRCDDVLCTLPDRRALMAAAMLLSGREHSLGLAILIVSFFPCRVTDSCPSLPCRSTPVELRSFVVLVIIVIHVLLQKLERMG